MLSVALRQTHKESKLLTPLFYVEERMDGRTDGLTDVHTVYNTANRP